MDISKSHMKGLHSLRHLLLECGDVEINPGPRTKYKNKAYLRGHFSKLNRHDILEGFRQCYRDDDNLTSVSKTGIWGRLLAYLGKPYTKFAILSLKRWCLKNDILEDFFLNVNNRQERNEVSEKKSKSFAQERKCSSSSGKISINNDDVSIHLADSILTENCKEVSKEFTDISANSSDDENATEAQVCDEDASSTKKNNVFHETEDKQIVNDYSTRLRLEKKGNDHEVIDTEDIGIQNITLSFVDVNSVHNNLKNMRSGVRDFKTFKSRSLESMEYLQLSNEQEDIGRHMVYQRERGVTHDMEKQVPYNLRPGRSIQSNKRYFNETYDYSTKRKRTQLIYPNSKIPVQPQNCKYKSDTYLQKADKEVFQECNDNIQSCTHANDKHLLDVTHPIDDALNSKDLEHTKEGNLFHVEENENFDKHIEQCSPFAKTYHIQLKNGTEHEKEMSSTDVLDHTLKQGNSFSVETLETAVGASHLDPFFEKTVPKSGYFYIPEVTWEQLKGSQKGRCFSDSNWEDIICDGIKDTNPFCVYMFKWHKVSIATERVSSTKPAFRGEGICKFEDCKNVLKFAMDGKRKVQYSMSPKVKHAITQNFSRPFRGDRRQQLHTKFQDGPKPFKCYMDKFRSVDNEIKLAGNFSDFGNSPQTFQKIASESRFTHTLEKSDFESLLRVSEKMITESTSKRLPGFIRHLSIYPPIIMYWSEAGVRIWHDMAKESTVFWDATGSVISSRQDRPHFYYYEMACLNPTKDQNIIPVTSLLSTLHSTPMIRFWISEFRRGEKKLYGHANVAIPRQINSDRSLVFIQAALSEFNNETMDEFKSRAWRIINGKASISDLTKVNPHACLSHVMSSFKKVVQSVSKTNSEFGMFCFSLILNSTTLNVMKETLTSVYQVLLSKTLDIHTENELKKIDEKLSKLSSKSLNDIELEIDNDLIETDSIFPELAQASRLTEEDYLNRSTTNAFYSMSDEILQKVKKQVSTTVCLRAQENKFHSTILAEKIHGLYMPTVPLWSNLLLGDLSRHGSGHVYQSYASDNKCIRGNTSIEKRFQVLKNISLGGKPVHRLDEFSVHLQKHVETLQNMAIIRSIKSGGKERRGRSTKTIEEEWEKKQTKLQSKSFGKYQKPPNKDFSASACKKQKQEKKTTTKITEKSFNKDGERNPEARKFSERSQSKQSFQPLLYIHNCDLENTRLIRLKGCIAQRHVVFPQSLETISREDKFIFEKTYGLSNIGNSCWFNAVLSALFPTDIMQIALDRYNKEMTFCPTLQKTLCIINNLYNEAEIPNTDICEALDDLHEAFQIEVTRQNDAHEFLTTFLSFLTRSLNYKNMRIRDIITCLTCGNVTIREEETTCLSLGVPAGIDNICVKDLLDDFFKDEYIEGARCDTCDDTKKYKKCVPVFFPDTIILSLQRYKVNKWDGIEKDRKDINPDNLINFKQYTTREDELIYKLESVVMHNGRQPTSGHYTALRKASDSFVLIDDDRVQMYHGNALNKDGYLLVYSSMEISQSTFLYMSCCCISNSALHSSLDVHMSNTTFTSPIKRQILDRFGNFKIITDLVPEDSKLLYLIYHSGVNVRFTVEYIQDVVNYLVEQYPHASKNIIGIDVLQYFCCDDCHEIVGKTKHFLQLNEGDIDLYRKDCFTVETNCTCGRKITGKQVISNFGETILIQSALEKTIGFPSLNLVLSGAADVIFPGVLFKFRVSVCFIPEEPSVILFPNNQCILLDNCEEITTLTKNEFINLTSKQNYVLFCDKSVDGDIERNLCSKEPGEAFPEMFGYEKTKVLSIDFDQTTERMLTAFSCSISNSKFNLKGNQVESFLTGWLTDLHIDLFLSALVSDDINENCIVLPCSWFPNMTDERISPQTYREWNDNFVLIPVNLCNRHWILIVVSLRQKCIVQLDPLGGFNDAVISKLQHFIRIQIFLNTGEQMSCNEWVVKDAGTSKSFPKQNDFDSCGVYVCLYATLLFKKALLHAKYYGQDFTIRQLVLNELLEKTFFQQQQPFGLKELLLLKNIDELVLFIASADVNDSGERLKRHKIFLRNPTYYHGQYLVNFGGDYFSAETIDEASRYLKKRYLLEKIQLFQKEVLLRDLPKESKLNQILASNWTYGNIYVRDVLVKEILIEILAKHLSIDYKSANNLCVMSEMSFINEKRNKLRQQREEK